MLVCRYMRAVSMVSAMVEAGTMKKKKRKRKKRKITTTAVRVLNAMKAKSTLA
jgi:hypothetical protein